MSLIWSKRWSCAWVVQLQRFVGSDSIGQAMFQGCSDSLQQDVHYVDLGILGHVICTKYRRGTRDFIWGGIPMKKYMEDIQEVVCIKCWYCSFSKQCSPEIWGCIKRFMTLELLKVKYFKWLLKVIKGQRAHFVLRPAHKGHIGSPKPFGRERWL